METISLKNHFRKGKKRRTTSKEGRLIKRLCIYDRRKSPGCMQNEMAQANVIVDCKEYLAIFF